jgi:glycine/D-amino acid oxidase-like deaminating enzyme
MPRIHRLAEGLYTPIGYNGRGITTGTIFGAAIAALLTGQRAEDLPLPLSEMKPVVTAPLMRRVYAAALTANQLWRSL